jgi:hypothetical protein
MRFDRAFHLFTFLFAVCLGAINSSTVRAQEAKPAVIAGGDKGQQIMIYRANHTPVAELDEAVSRLLGDGDSGVRIATTPNSNSMALVGDAEALGRIGAMLAKMDRAPQMVRLHVYVISPDDTSIDRSAFSGTNSAVEENIRSMTNAGKISVVNEVHLTTLEQQEAMVQAGKTKSVESGRSSRQIPSSALAAMQRRAESDERAKAQLASLMARSKSYQRMNVGSILKVTSRVSGDDKIVLDLSWERSDVGPALEDGTPADVTQATTQATVHVVDGVSSFVQQISDPMLQSNWLLVVGAETL